MSKNLVIGRQEWKNQFDNYFKEYHLPIDVVLADFDYSTDLFGKIS